MGFHSELVEATRADQQALFDVPFVRAAVAGELTREQYVAFLAQAYHHVHHTVPLLFATGAALPDRLGWLRDAIAHYVAEEQGHDLWILDDIAEAGGDPEQVVREGPGHACDLLVAYAYDVVQRRNPIGFFGMVHVLEGASVRGASRAAEMLEGRLGLPNKAFTYLYSHGELDREHVDFFGGLMDRVDEPADRRFVLHAAHTFSRLYADVFRALEPRVLEPVRA
jgi:thiaminase